MVPARTEPSRTLSATTVNALLIAHKTFSEFGPFTSSIMVPAAAVKEIAWKRNTDGVNTALTVRNHTGTGY